MRHTRALVFTTTLLFAAACQPDAPTPVEPETETAEARVAAAADPTPSSIRLRPIGGFEHGGEGAAEISAYDEVSKRLFVVNGAQGTVDVLDFRRPASPTRIATLSVADFGAGVNSVATHKGLVALAIEANVKQDPGTVAFYNALTLDVVSSATVGALPDMVTFSPSGRFVLVANEGEPNGDYTVDPEGSVSIIDVRNRNRPVVRTAGFTAFNGRIEGLRAAGVRIFGPGASVAQDLEPEYVTVSDDETTAWVSLQENNAFAVVDIRSAQVVDILPLGFKDHNIVGKGLDASDRDDAVNIRPWRVLGMYMPDGIASYSAHGRTYIVSANEGDARDYDGFAEEERVKDLELNPALFPDEICGGPCTDDEALGRLTVTTTLGQNPSGTYDDLFAFGARSFSIWTDRGERVWDSGDEFERLTASLPNVAFNATNDENEFDNRSDNKGPEPEGVVLGQLGDKTYAFIGLERVGGVMVYDVTDPHGPFFVDYVNTRMGDGGDLAPEGLAFIPAREAPGKKPLLVVSHEVSGTTRVFEVELLGVQRGKVALK